MFKVIKDGKISFYDESNNEIMYIEFINDECVWYFNNSNTITITEDMELYEPLKAIMDEEYIFDYTSKLKNYKTNDKLVWYSDCAYNPDDEWSINNVSYLTIEYIGNIFKLKCNNPFYNEFNKEHSHLIIFSPDGNGVYSKNTNTEQTLQTEFVVNVYQKLLNNEKVRRIK